MNSLLQMFTSTRLGVLDSVQPSQIPKNRQILLSTAYPGIPIARLGCQILYYYYRIGKSRFGWVESLWNWIVQSTPPIDPSLSIYRPLPPNPFTC